MSFILDVAQALNQARIPYAVVGGFAVALHGAVRGTVDLDIILNFSEKDFIAAETVFQKLGLISRLPVNAQDIYRFRAEYIKNRNLIAWSFYHPKNSIQQLDVIITNDLKKLKTTIFKISGIPVKVLAIEALIQMKKESARPQDLEDIQALKKLTKKHEK